MRSLIVLLLSSCGPAMREAARHAADLRAPVTHNLKVASWNVECLNRAPLAELAAALEATGADVILLQEDLLYPEVDGPSGLQISGYRKAAECRRNKLWDTYNEYKNGARYMSNSAYYRLDTVELVGSGPRVVAADSVDPRCAAQLDIQPRGTSLVRPIRVESTHLTGGRFSDSKWEERVGLKAAQVRSLMELSPDVVAGDLNSYPTPDNARRAQEKYSIYLDAVKSGKETEYLAWTTEPVDEFARDGMVRLTHDVQTSQYGGTVDHAFTGGFRGGLRVIGTGIRELSSNSWALSDHNGLVFDIHVTEERLRE